MSMTKHWVYRKSCSCLDATSLVLLICCSISGIHCKSNFANSRRNLHQSQEYFNEVKLKLSRDSLIQQLKKHNPQVDISNPKGIAIPAGGPVLLRNAAALVSVIRWHYESKLPVEVFYHGAEEWHEAAGSLLKGLSGVTCIDTSTKVLPEFHNATKFQGFGLKILALYACSFKQVLVLDSDNLPLVSPDILFSKAALQDSGNLFFPDYWQREGHEPVKAMAYHAFDLIPPWETDRQGYMATESGQILLDRSRHADVLEWLLFLQSHEDIFKKYMYGDKDFYPLAFALASKSAVFTQVGVAPRMALHEEPESTNYLQLGMVQSDEMGVLSFLHRTTYGAKRGWDGEMNPVRCYWPHFLSSPIHGKLAPRVVGWDDQRRMCLINKRWFNFQKGKQMSMLKCKNMSFESRNITRCPIENAILPRDVKLASTDTLWPMQSAIKALEQSFDAVISHELAHMERKGTSISNVITKHASKTLLDMR